MDEDADPFSVALFYHVWSVSVTSGWTTSNQPEEYFVSHCTHSPSSARRFAWAGPIQVLWRLWSHDKMTSLGAPFCVVIIGLAAGMREKAACNGSVLTESGRAVPTPAHTAAAWWRVTSLANNMSEDSWQFHFSTP